MAFAFRKMFGIGYFKQADSDERSAASSEDSVGKKRRRASNADVETNPFTHDLNPSIRLQHSVKTSSEPVKYFSAQKSDAEYRTSPRGRRSKKLRLDKINTSIEDSPYANCMIENTPKKISLGLARDDDEFRFEFDKSIDNIFQFDSKSISDVIDNSDIESLSDNSDLEKEKSSIPMCRKVSEVEEFGSHSWKLRRSASNDDFSDIESDRNEDQRQSLLLSYQMRIEKADKLIQKLLTEFQFHIEVSKVFYCKSHITTLPGSDVSKLPKMLGEIKHIDSARGASPNGSWNIVMEKEDAVTKLKLRDQLLSLKGFIEEFVDTYLNVPSHSEIHLDVPAGNSTMAEYKKTKMPVGEKRKEKIVSKSPKTVPIGRKIRINRRKYEKGMNDFPDLREILQNLFALDGDHTHSINASVSANNVTALMSEFEESSISRCNCQCAEHRNGPDSSVKSTDSGLPTKLDEKSDTIASSIGDFALDNSQLTAYSESLEQVLSYNSFNDSSLILSMLQKSAIERITFYVQVHGVQMTTDSEDSLDTRNILFSCTACDFFTPDEQGLLRHILCQAHCEKLHFLYKSAYIKRCFASGEEIKPSTILNSMTMYRDDNKIVCFGDGKFACSLCFENDIVGESVLMAHCYEREHVEKRNRLDEILQEDVE